MYRYIYIILYIHTNYAHVVLYHITLYHTSVSVSVSASVAGLPIRKLRIRNFRAETQSDS